jgi:hypothetical protein
MAASIQFACPARALKPNTAGLLFLRSPDGRTTHGVLLLTLEGRQNSRNGLSRPPCFLSCCPGRRPMSPRSAQHEAILYIPGRSSSPAVPELFTARSSFLREAFGLSHYSILAWAIPTCHAHATRHSLQRTKHSHHLATPSSPRRVASTATRSLPVHQRTLFPLFCLLPSPPLSSPRSNNASSGRRLHTCVGLRSPN